MSGFCMTLVAGAKTNTTQPPALKATAIHRAVDNLNATTRHVYRVAFRNKVRVALVNDTAHRKVVMVYGCPVSA